VDSLLQQYRYGLAMSKNKNTGTPSQDEFEARIALLGKKAYLHKITDTKEVRGLTKTKAWTKAQPSDYILTVNGAMHYAEVKSTTDPLCFRKSNITTDQLAAARQQLAAGGQYWFYIHRLLDGAWFKVPASLFVLPNKDRFRWADFDAFAWS
jgi:penicillin-binding protein-related factor A (putative recombinase)